MNTLRPGSGVGKYGVVLGNGPQIDALSQVFWNNLTNRQDVISLGVNRICCSEACIKAEFFPDLHLIYDSPRVGVPFYDILQNGLKRLAGKTWRLVSSETGAEWYHHDQVIARADVKLQNTSVDAACDLLYRIGIREIYLYGVEMREHRHCRTLPPEPVEWARRNWESSDDAAKSSWVAQWRIFLGKHPGLKLYSGAPHSLLVTESVIPYGSISKAA